MEKIIKLGDYYKDKVTRYSGTATSRTEYLTGAARVALERLGDAETRYFDESRLEPSIRPSE